MYIKQIRLQNIKCFKDFSIDFVDDKDKPRLWTSILGNNGVGKSVVLQSIALALTGGNSIHDVLPYPLHWVRAGEKFGTIEVTIIFDKNELPSKNSKKELTLQYHMVGPNGATINHRYFPGPEIVEHFDSKNYVYFQKILKESSPFLAGYGTYRGYAKTHPRSEGDKLRNPLSRRISSLFRDDTVMTDVEGWLRELEYNALKFNTPLIKKYTKKRWRQLKIHFQKLRSVKLAVTKNFMSKRVLEKFH